MKLRKRFECNIHSNYKCYNSYKCYTNEWQSQGGQLGSGRQAWDLLICQIPTLVLNFHRQAFDCSCLVISAPSSDSTEPNRPVGVVAALPWGRRKVSLAPWQRSSSPNKALDAAQSCQLDCFVQFRIVLYVCMCVHVRARVCTHTHVSTFALYILTQCHICITCTAL